MTNANNGNQYMVKSAENRMRSNLELLLVINIKSRPPIYLGPTKIVPDISRPKKSRHYFDALNGIHVLFMMYDVY
jgi:hypothetical protein